MRGHISASCLAVFFLLSHASVAHATLQITLANLNVEGQNSYPLGIYVTGGDLITDFYLNVQIGDGGPLLGGTSQVPGTPYFDYDGSAAARDAVLVNGTIFQNNHTAVDDFNDDGSGGTFGSLVMWLHISTANGPVAANGLLATLPLSFLGVPFNVYFPLIMSDGNQPWIGGTTTPLNSNGTSYFWNGDTPVAANILDGSLYRGPEPSSLVLAIFALVGLAVVARRKVAA